MHGRGRESEAGRVMACALTEFEVAAKTQILRRYSEKEDPA
jgi:hypothetical protein